MDDRILREQLIQVLTGRNAHFTFNDAVIDFPIDKINDRPSPWSGARCG